MKIQELAIILIIIILPISIILSEYTQFQIKTINNQTVYDAKLTAATYDAIKAFQLNTKNETYSDISNVKVSDLEASVNAFRNSIMSAFELTGYSEDELNNYIPALVYTLYDGFCIYSPYENTNHRYETDEEGNIVKDPVTGEYISADGNKEYIYGVKPYINYSCRYIKGSIDVVITFTLDNFVTIQGNINGQYVNKSGYLIDNINIIGDDVSYNGVKIEKEALSENIGGSATTVPYIKENGIKYYLKENQIVCVTNGRLEEQYSIESNPTKYYEYKDKIENNIQAQKYYKDAYEFTQWVKVDSGLDSLEYKDAVNEEGNAIWEGNNTNIFKDTSNNIENELSNFNQHRLAVIRNIIERNLEIAISNYNEYSHADNVFQMPELKEDEWEHITNNIAMISFLQGLPIGGKIYNGYTLVTNSESEEVVLEENIYILGDDEQYHRIGDKGLETGGTVKVDCSGYTSSTDSAISAGRLNLDFNRSTITNNDSKYYYYPLKAYNASYDSIVMQNNVTTYDDIYTYVNGQSDEYKKAFYTALGRERNSKYKINRVEDLSELYIPIGYKIVEGTDLDTGLVIENDLGNQFVWIEVPKTTTVYPTAGLSITLFNNENYDKIEKDLRDYVTDYKNDNFKDEYSSNVLGLTETEYYNLKKRMLKSIYKNGGFYIGRYETGIDYSESYRTGTGETIQTPIIKQNAYPYNYVSIKQAQELSESLGQTGYTTSLMFGIQWDLTLKYLETKGVSKDQLKANSTGWGNHYASSYNITNANSKYYTGTWYSSAYGEKVANTSVLLSTGASETFKKQNIYDLTGNMWEYTLERAVGTGTNIYIERGEYGGSTSINDPSACARGGTAGDSQYFRGFRTTLYKND